MLSVKKTGMSVRLSVRVPGPRQQHAVSAAPNTILYAYMRQPRVSLPTAVGLALREHELPSAFRAFPQNKLDGFVVTRPNSIIIIRRYIHYIHVHIHTLYMCVCV